MAAKEPERMKAYGLYVDSKKVGTLETSDYKLTSGDELHVTAEGVMAGPELRASGIDKANQAITSLAA